MFHHRNTTPCSAANSGFEEGFQKEAGSRAARRLEEGCATGARVLISTCPDARARMNEVRARGRGMRAVDRGGELAAEHLRICATTTVPACGTETRRGRRQRGNTL